jgi:pyrimidine operon attenuation protein / uracil phosphoribosyltransferase
LNGDEKLLLDGDQVGRTLTRVAHEIVERNADLERVVLVGIYTRGVVIAERLRATIAEMAGHAVGFGALDISFYRDDVGARGGQEPATPNPVVNATRFEAPVEGRTVILVDDVLYTGRTVKAAIDAVFDYGRPGRVQLAVLADRGHRELPVRADYVGKNLPTRSAERIRVRLAETDGIDEIVLIPAPMEVPA